MVAWTNAPRLTALVIMQPDAAGDVPSGPVSWYGVARPRALSGFAGTMMSQLTLAAAAGADALAEALGQGDAGSDAGAEADAGSVADAGAVADAGSVADAGAVAGSVAEAVAVAVAVAGSVAEAVAVAGAMVETSAAGLAAGASQEPSADWLITENPCPETAKMIPRVRPNAIGMARGTAIRAARLLPPRRRHTDRCPLCIQSTSMDVPCDAPGGSR